MNCLIGLSLALLAIVGGMMLLAQTQKENLGNVYKAVSYFVIIASFLGFLGAVGCGLCRLAHCGRSGDCARTEKCHKMKSRCSEMESCHRMDEHGGRCKKTEGECGKKMNCKKMCNKSQMMEWEEGEEEMEDINVEIIQKKLEKQPVEPKEPVNKTPH